MADPLVPVDPRKSFAVFASAGTGKTWLLVARILRLLLAGTPPDSILAITFTRKAAAEIQQKLTERLEEWLHLDDQGLTRNLEQIGLDAPEQYLTQARALFEAVQFDDRGIRIATFHSFFQDLLQRFPMEAGIPARFTIPQREQLARLCQASEDGLFEAVQRAPHGALSKSMGVIMAEIPSLSELRRILAEFQAHMLEWRAFDEGMTAEQICAHLRDEVFCLDHESELIDMSEVKPDLYRLVDLLKQSGASERSFPAKSAARLLHAAEHGEAGRFNQLRQINGVLNDPEQMSPRDSLWPGSKAAQKRLGTSGTEELEVLLGHLHSRFLRALDWQLREKSCALNGHWYNVVRQLTENYQNLKRIHGEMDYDDLLWFSNRLMNGSGEWVQYKLGQRFRHVLVDEFQDTDPLSWQTLKVFLDALHETDESPGSAFIVGDTKQSIYQWRRANPEVQKAADAYLQAHLRAGAHVSMDSSRRSAKVIVDFVNAAFCERGVFPLPGFSPHRTYLTDMWGRVELLPLVPKESPRKAPQAGSGEPLRDPLQPRPEAHATHIEEMADQIAERIQQIVEQRFAIAERSGGTRAARFRDCMILVNRRTHVPQIERALSQRGILFARQSRQTLLNHLEVRDMHALLQFLIRPADDLHLVQVLRSPLYCITDEELMDLASLSIKPGYWIDRLEHLADEKEPGHPLRRAAGHFRAWRKQVGRIPTHDLLDRIYFETDALRCYQRAWPDERGERAASNLVRFIELTLEFDSGRYPSTAAFVHFIEEMRCGRVEGFDAPDPVSLKSDDQDDRVQILTVHAAKGMERPIVIYAELSKPPKRGRVGNILLDWPADKNRPQRFLFRPHKEDMDSSSRQCLEAMRQKRQAEEHNLAYVAFTRARQMLILCQHEERHGLLQGLFPPSSGVEPGRLACGPEPTSLPSETASLPSAPEPDTTGLDRPINLPDIEDPSEVGALGAEDGFERAGEAPHNRDGRERGIVIHAMLSMLQGGEPDPGSIAKLARGRNHSPQDPDFQRWLDEARQTVGDPRLAAVFRPDPRTRVFVEIPVVCRIGEDERFGIIDRLLVSSSQVWIIDFKTHPSETAEEQRRLAGHYAKQMGEYARYIRIIYPGRAIRCSLLFTRNRQLHDLPCT